MAKKTRSVYARGERQRLGYVKEVRYADGTFYDAYTYQGIKLGTHDTPEDASDEILDWFDV